MSDFYNFTLTFTVRAESEQEAKKLMADLEQSFMNDWAESWSVGEVAVHKVVFQ